MLFQEPMSSHTTFRIGGPADYFLIPKRRNRSGGVLDICREEGLPYFILGNGSNLLVSDRGYRGVIIQIFRNLNQITVEGESIRAGAGALLSGIAAAAKKCRPYRLRICRGDPGNHRRGRCDECRCLRRGDEGYPS